MPAIIPLLEFGYHVCAFKLCSHLLAPFTTHYLSPICLDRIDIIKQACGVFRILGEDALSVMYSLTRASEREEALMAMFAKMAGR